MSSHFFHQHDWSAYDYFIATSVFAIFLRMKD